MMDSDLLAWAFQELARRADEDHRIEACPSLDGAIKRERAYRRRATPMLLGTKVKGFAPKRMTRGECRRLLEEAAEIVQRARAAA
jgi:hypothetical protein